MTRLNPPYRRVLESKYIDDKKKRKLNTIYDRLNPADLKRKLSVLEINIVFKLGKGDQIG
jgi:hypothetical protein